MKTKVSLLIFFCLLNTSISKASTATSAPKQPMGSKQEWLQAMQKDLPTVLCQDDHYFVQCFNVTQAECLETTSLYVKACLSNITLALPAQLSKDQGEYWGQMVGRCSYDLYEKFMTAKKKDLSTCQPKASNHDDLPKPSQAIP